MVVVEGLVDGVTPEPLLVEPLPEPAAPIELVLPPDDVSLLLLVEPGVVLPPLGLLPIELVLPPVLPLPVLPLPVLPPIALPLPLLPGVPLLLLLEVEVSGAGLVVVVDELEELVGVPV